MKLQHWEGPGSSWMSLGASWEAPGASWEGWKLGGGPWGVRNENKKENEKNHKNG